MLELQTETANKISIDLRQLNTPCKQLGVYGMQVNETKMAFNITTTSKKKTRQKERNLLNTFCSIFKTLLSNKLTHCFESKSMLNMRNNLIRLSTQKQKVLFFAMILIDHTVPASNYPETGNTPILGI